MSAIQEIPPRKDVPVGDTWDLSSLYTDTESWEKDFLRYEKFALSADEYRGTLAKSPKDLIKALYAFRDGMLMGESLNYFAFLRSSEDEGDTESRSRAGRLMMMQGKVSAAWSWLEPELQNIPSDKMNSWIRESEFSDFRVYLQRILRYKPHLLSESEERLLALQLEKDSTSKDVFSLLTNVDMDFGLVETPDGSRPLSQASFLSFMHNPDREVRKHAYEKFYSVFNGHKNALAAIYQGSCQVNRYQATVRKYGSSIEAALFPDNVPISVYDNLIDTVSANLKPLHKYYGIKKRTLKLDELRHYDVYVPIIGSVKAKHTWNEAVEKVLKAIAPLGEEYTNTLQKGLLGRWVDRYENKGKHPGAFSAGSYSGDPYILMNYKDDVIRDMFTLAHEAGHSMHSWYSVKSNPFMHYNYSIFEAEVASTFNEQLLFKYLYENADSRELELFLINTKIDDILATLYRQTMFAEFEKISHSALESGIPLTADFLRKEYRKLLEKYFGPEMKFEETSDLECMRIPHFYNAFYVYKYATGVSAAIALSKKVLEDGNKAKEDYFAFLKAGGSLFPIENLKNCGVDMSTPQPIQAACDEFAALVDKLDDLLMRQL